MKPLRIFAFADEASSQIDGQIAALRRNGLQGLEIRNVDGQNVPDISLEKAREVHKKLTDAGLSVWSIGSPIGKIDIQKDNFEQHLQKYLHTLEIARALGAEKLRMFSFYLPKGQDPAPFRQQVIDRLSRMAELAFTGMWPPAVWKSYRPCPSFRAFSILQISSSAARRPGLPGKCCTSASPICISRMRFPTAAWCLPGRGWAMWPAS